MAKESGFFFDSNNGDRKYNAKSFELWLKKFFTSGVFTGDLQVTANGNMTVNVSTGYANVDGKVGFFEEDKTLNINTANGSMERIDTIVIERDDIERNISLKVITGTPATSPVATALVRTGGIYQLGLAQIRVPAGETKIVQANIKDTREDTSLCGLVAGTVKEIDVSHLRKQFDAICDECEQNFEEWFEEIRNQLSDDVAGNLQNQISAERARIDELVAQKSNEAAETTELKFEGKYTECTAIKVISNGICAELYITNLKWTSSSLGVDTIAAFPEALHPLTQSKEGIATRPMIYSADDIQICLREGKLQVQRKNSGATPQIHTLMVSYPLKNPVLSELADLRIGAEGEVFPNAGDAVREQFREVKESQKPFVIYEESAEEYASDPTYGDAVLEAKLAGREVLICVQNKTENTLYRNFMPVLQYQLPDENNDYLTLFYLKDGIAENIMYAMAAGSFAGVYGEITMKLSKKYTECPLK